MTQAFNLSQFANKLNTSGQTDNTGLQNSSVTVTAGTGMSGGGAVALGSSVTLTNAGVTSVVAGTGISVSGATGAVTVTATGGGSVGVRSTIFTASGTFTVPTGVTSVKVTCVGGGGGGGGYRDNGSGGGGGGGGGYAIKWVTGLTPAGTVTVTIGAAGGGVSSFSAQAGTGGTTSFGTYCVATGGTGGYGGPNGANKSGGEAGQGTTGDIRSSSNTYNLDSLANIGRGQGGYNCCGPLSGRGGVSLFTTYGNVGAPSGGSATGPGYGGAGGSTGGNGGAGLCIVEY